MLRKRFISLILCLSLCLSLGQEVSTVEAKSNLHAYTLAKVAVQTKSGKVVKHLSKGVTFTYLKKVGSRVKINYYGKKRWVSTENLILNDSLNSYILNNQSSFNSKVRTNSKVKVLKRIGGKTLYSAKKNEEFKVFGSLGSYYKVQVDGKFGYIPASSVSRKIYVDVLTFPSYSGSTKGEKIVNYALQFVGNPYVWGGTSLTSGCDCSGFVQQVYKQFGYSLPRCSYQQAEVGKRVSFSNLKPGDLIFYYRGSRIGHVTMYIGNGKCVQARGAKYGIVVTDYDYSTPAWACRII